MRRWRPRCRSRWRAAAQGSASRRSSTAPWKSRTAAGRSSRKRARRRARATASRPSSSSPATTPWRSTSTSDNPLARDHARRAARRSSRRADAPADGPIWASRHAACRRDTIIRVSRQSNSGTYEFFREDALARHDFKLGTLDMNGSKEVVELVGTHAVRHRLQRHGLRDACGEDAADCPRSQEPGHCAVGRRRRSTRATRSPGRCTCTRPANRAENQNGTSTGSSPTPASGSWQPGYVPLRLQAAAP